MKTIILLLLPIFISAQEQLNYEDFYFTPTSYGNNYITWFTTDTTMPFRFVYLKLDSTNELTIQGDTVELIRYLIAEKLKSDSILLDYIDVVSASVSFANTVPDYLRQDNSPQWYRYWAHLKKLGYEINKRKQ